MVAILLHTFVLLVDGDLLRRGLHLEQQLDSLDGSDGRLGHGGRYTTGDEVLGEREGVFGHFELDSETEETSRDRNGPSRRQTCALGATSSTKGTS